MRNLNLYDLIVCDIDDTLIYGFWTQVMHYTWQWFKSPVLSALLMAIQDIFNLYKVNKKLKFMIDNSSVPILFLTVRAENPHTFNILNKIFPARAFELSALASDYGFIDKPDIVEYNLAEYPNILLIDDNKSIRDNTAELGVDTLDPIALREGLIG